MSVSGNKLAAALLALLLAIGVGLHGAARDVLFGAEAHAIIPRSTTGWIFGPMPVWTNGSTSTPGLFHPMSKPIDAKGLIAVRFSLEMSEDSGNCKMRPAIRYSNDAVGFDQIQEAPDGAAFRTRTASTMALRIPISPS